jgi:peptidoglycan/LPS O-acetylase OafA/YrhL
MNNDISKKLEPLDGLRGIGALIIALLFHYEKFIPVQQMPLYRIVKWPFINGWILVELFFIISGLIFTCFYGKKISQSQVTAEGFFIARFSRLYPVHLFTLLIVAMFQMARVLCGLKQFAYNANDIHQFILNVFMLQRVGLDYGESFNAVSWTLSVEAIMYLIFFIVRKRVKTQKQFIFYCTLLIFLGFSCCKISTDFPLFNAYIGRGLVAFYWGCILFYILDIASVSSHKGILILICTVLLLGISISGSAFGYDFFGRGGYVSTAYTFILFPCMIYLVINIKFLRFIFASKPLSFLGKISFAIYMCHIPVQLIIDTTNRLLNFELNYASKSFWVGYSVSVILVATIVHKFIEVPAREYIRKQYKLYKCKSIKAII